MKQFAGTPGPWQAVEHSWSATGIYAGDKRIAELDIYDQADEVTEADLSAEMVANARLMAASKDLLEALQEYIEADESDMSCREWMDLRDRARAAIAKALGE